MIFDSGPDVGRADEQTSRTQVTMVAFAIELLLRFCVWLVQSIVHAVAAIRVDRIRRKRVVFIAKEVEVEVKHRGEQIHLLAPLSS